MLPKDPVLLLSVVNTKLRDSYPNLEELCHGEDADPDPVTNALAAGPKSISISNMASPIFFGEAKKIPGASAPGIFAT